MSGQLSRALDTPSPSESAEQEVPTATAPCSMAAGVTGLLSKSLISTLARYSGEVPSATGCSVRRAITPSPLPSPVVARSILNVPSLSGTGSLRLSSVPPASMKLSCIPVTFTTAGSYERWASNPERLATPWITISMSKEPEPEGTLWQGSMEPTVLALLAGLAKGSVSILRVGPAWALGVPGTVIKANPMRAARKTAVPMSRDFIFRACQ